MSQFVCLSGLPRSGSTILSAILDQNPLIHAEGNSAVCQFMWDMYQSGTVHAAEQLNGTYRQHTMGDIIAGIPKLYYKDIAPTKKIIVDKCRAWTTPVNITILRKYIDPDIKIIVLERSVTAIIKSFMKLYKKNNWSDAYMHEIAKAMLVPNVEPIMRSIIGINMAKKEQPNKTFLFIQYNDLMAQPEATLQRIYDFCGWAPFKHDFQHIVNAHPENDEFYKLKGFHEIRSAISPTENTIVLPADIQAKCAQIDKLMGYIM